MSERDMAREGEIITSAANPLVKRVGLLSGKRSEREAAGAFVIEGEKELLAAAGGGIELETVLYCPALLGGNQRLRSVEAVARTLGAGGATFAAVSQRVYAKLAYRDGGEGLIAVGRAPRRRLEDLKLRPRALVVVVDGVEKPGNLGALLRTADAAGVDAVVVCEPDLDLYNPNVVRASLGALFTVPTCLADGALARAWVGQRGLSVIAASPAAEHLYWEVDYTGAVAVVLGSEEKGLGREWLEAVGRVVRIPMAGAMDSLNLAASGAILLYEAVRQRR